MNVVFDEPNLWYSNLLLLVLLLLFAAVGAQHPPGAGLGTHSSRDSGPPTYSSHENKPGAGCGWQLPFQFNQP
jgi:hypothetical protein